MKFSIVIPTLGRLNCLRKLLSSLEKLQNIELAEIIIIQNPPSDHIFQLKNEYPKLNLRISSSPKGVNQARNVGLNQAQGEIVVFLDDDCWISNSQFLSIHEEAHKKNPWAFAVGGFYRNTGRSSLQKIYGEIQSEWLQSNILSPQNECTTLLGGHFSIKKNQNHGFQFDPFIQYGGAETEFFFRLRRLGLRYLLLNLEIEHNPEMSIFSFIRKAYLQGKTHRRLLKEESFIAPKMVHIRAFRPHIYKKIYHFVFHGYLPKYHFQKSNAVVRFINLRLSRLHQNICFYLSKSDRS